MEAITSFIYSFPAWIVPAVFAAVCGIGALLAYLAGRSQGYTREDYRAARMRARNRRRRRR